jgi:hypothetical protein
MKNSFEKIKSNTLVYFLLAFIFMIFLKFLFLPPINNVYYIELLKQINKENIESNNSIFVSVSELNYFKECGNKNQCFKIYYENYALNHGAEKAFYHLQKVIYLSNYDFSLYCNISSFSIGKGQFIKEGEKKTFEIFPEEEYFFHNQCLTSYIQGIVVGFLEKNKNSKSLQENIAYICNKHSPYKYFEPACIQGVGNYLAESTNFDLNKSLRICDSLEELSSFKTNCYFGVFITNRLKFNDILKENMKKDIQKTKDGSISFCENFEQKFRATCYMDMSRFLKVEARNNKNYSEVVNSCEIYKNDLYRLSCIKYNVRASVNDGYYTRLKEMCIDSTQNTVDRVFCVAVYSNMLSSAISGSDSSENFLIITKNICGILKSNESGYCFNLIKNKKLDITKTDIRDLESREDEKPFFWYNY